MKIGLALFVPTVYMLVASCSDIKPKSAHLRGIGKAVFRVQRGLPMGGSLQSAADFAIWKETLFILDWRAMQVVMLAPAPGSWQVTRTFSRSGNGPGELTEPVSLAFETASGTLAVLERSGEIELFDTAGNYVRSELVNLPCVSARTQLITVGSRWLVAQRCFGDRFRELSADTAYMLLAEVDVGKPPVILAAQPVMNRRGDWGSIFAANWPLAATPDRLVFGSGVDSCIFRGIASALTKSCELGLRRHSAPAPEGFDAGNRSTKASAWPDPLPLFVGVTHVGRDAILVRPITSDSIAFESLRAPGRYFAVAPLDTFVGCRPGGCLWHDDSGDETVVEFIGESKLARLLDDASS